MNLNLDVVKHGAYALGFALKEHAPEILEVAGTVGVIASCVMACKATTKISQITEEHKTVMEAINTQEIGEEYTEEDKKKDTVITYTHTVLKLTKTYAPAVILGALSLGCLHGSNMILRERNAALASAFIAVDRAFKEYRGRVAERFGEDVEKQIRLNLKEQKIEKVVTDEDGKEKKVKEKELISDGVESGYMKYFAAGNPNWAGGDMSHVEGFLTAQQNWANHILRVKGHITLNEVYDLCGFEETQDGMVVGWIYDPAKGDDNYVELDVTRCYIPNEYGEFEKAYAVDFNVDGLIFDKMQNKKAKAC